MPSVLIQVADAVTAELNDPDNEWGKSFEAVRSYGDWRLPLEESGDELRVDVVPLANMATDMETRGSAEKLPTIAIYVRKKIKTQDSDHDSGRPALEAIDGLVEFVEAIEDHFIALRLPTYDEAIWRKSESKIVDAVLLNKPRQFTGKVLLTFAVSKDL